MTIPERDWKHLRTVHRPSLERFCARVLEECGSVSADPSRTAHERYLALYKLVQDRDDDMACAFNDMRRSRAYDRLIAMHSLGTATEEEWAEFSEEIRESFVRVEQFPTARNP
jgi:hypothetical protein